MITIPAGIQTLIDSGEFVPATCVLVTRSDGVEQGFTSYQSDLVIDGVTYERNSNLDVSAVSSKINTGVSNFNVFGAVQTDTITAEDLLAGLYDGASIETFVVHGPDTSLGSFTIHKGFFGEVQFGEDTHSVEVVGLSSKYKQRPLRTVLPACDVAEFGDSRCAFNIATRTHTADVFSVTTRKLFHVTGLGSLGAGYFDHGTVEFNDGANAGLKLEIKQSLDAGSHMEIQTQLPFPYDIQAGDEVEVIGGCDRRFETCVANNNAENFRGYPHLPGLNQILKVGR